MVKEKSRYYLSQYAVGYARQTLLLSLRYIAYDNKEWGKLEQKRNMEENVTGSNSCAPS